MPDIPGFNPVYNFSANETVSEYLLRRLDENSMNPVDVEIIDFLYLEILNLIEPTKKIKGCSKTLYPDRRKV